MKYQVITKANGIHNVFCELPPRFTEERTLILFENEYDKGGSMFLANEVVAVLSDINKNLSDKKL